MQKRLGGDLRKESNDWLDDDHPAKCSPLRSHKQSPKSPLEKTQRIKKPKKEPKPAREEPREIPTSTSLQERLVGQAVKRLRECSSKEDITLPIYKKLTRERLLQFLEMIEAEYSQVVSLYLGQRRSSESSGSLKGLFLRFIDGIVAAFPVLNNIVFQYAFQYYASGPLQMRFTRLMDKNITPILKLMSEKYNKQLPQEKMKVDLDASTHFSHSPQRQQLDDFETQETRKSEKRRRQRNKKREEHKEDDTQSQGKVESKPPKEEVERSVLELTSFLENLCIQKQSRVECRIEEQHITRWRQLPLHPPTHSL